MSFNNKNLFFNVYSTCKLVKGKKRGSIVDLQRGRIEFVPNELIDILIKFKGNKILKVYSENSESDFKIIDEYFEFLIKKEIIFLSNEKIRFLTKKYNKEVPNKLISAIVDLNKEINYNIFTTISKIDGIGCENIQIRMYDFDVSIDFLNKLLEQFNNTSFRNVEVILKFCENKLKSYQQTFNRYNRVNLVYFHSYFGKDKVDTINSVKYIFTSENITSSSFCGYITPFFFDISANNFYLGENFNSCLYKKISIDIDGNIKNCPSMQLTFGKIDNTCLNEVLSTSKFRKYWNVTKEKIEICKECEFRKICTDCRAYLKEDEIYQKPKYCNYDPEKLKWL